MEEVSHKPLSQTISFQMALGVPLCVGLIVGVVIGFNSSLGGVCFSFACVNYFVEVYKVPITISSLSLPLVALVAAVQRSNEASIQIVNGQRQYSEAVNNNRVGNFLKHREGFYKLIENFREIESNNRESCEVLIDVGYLYMRLFPENSFKMLTFDQELTGSWFRLRERFRRMEDNLNNGAGFPGAFDLGDFLEDLQGVLNILTVRLNPSILCTYEKDEKNYGSIIRGSKEDIHNVIETAGIALRLYLAVSIYAGFDVKLALYQVFYSQKIFEMLEMAKVNVKFEPAQQL